MNVIDKRRKAEGLLYGFRIESDATEAEIDALIAARDTLRKAGLIASADAYGRIVFHRSEGDTRRIAINLFV